MKHGCAQSMLALRALRRGSFRTPGIPLRSWDGSGQLGRNHGRTASALPGWRDSSWPFQGWADCYIAFNDPPGELLHIILTLVRARLLEVDRLVSVAGSMTALNFLTALNPGHIHFFDMNPCAIQWGRMLCELILLSDTPQEFVSRLFARNVTEFEHHSGKLTVLNQDRYLMWPASAGLRNSTQRFLSHEAAAVYSQILRSYQDRHEIHHNYK